MYHTPHARGARTRAKLVTATQYLDSDVMPLRNMDGFFTLNASLTMCAGEIEPVHAGWMVVRPDCNVFSELMNRIANAPSPWNLKVGWGRPDFEWMTIHGRKGRGYAFNGADGDQGLWYHYARFQSDSAYILYHKFAISYRNGSSDTLRLDRGHSRTTLLKGAVEFAAVDSSAGNPCKWKLPPRTTYGAVARAQYHTGMDAFIISSCRFTTLTHAHN